MCAQWSVRVFLVIWAVSLTAVGACLMVSHWVPLPNPGKDSLGHNEYRLLATAGEWTASHFLYADCPCSRRVFEHVLERPPHKGIHEQIVLIGGDASLAQRTQRQGFLVDQIAPEQLKAKYGVEAAPLFVVVDPGNQIRYSGGYTNRKQGFDIQDNAIISDLLAGKDVETRPVYGCAVSKSLQAIVDPLQIKPSSRN